MRVAPAIAMPFTREQFLSVFARYNEAIWPMQLALLLLALSGTALLFTRRTEVIGAILALLFLWAGVGYHFAYFTAINPAAWIFGAAFVLGSYFFAKNALSGALRFELGRSSIAYAIIVYALVGYPLVGMIAGEEYPHIPTFGAPCPTTIFAFGILLLAKRPVPASVFVVPFVWSAIASVAAFQLGIVQDYGLVLAAVASAAVLIARRILDSNDSSLLRPRGSAHRV
jgi:hypothetical protein